MLFEIVI